MIERGSLPTIRRVALCTGLTELPAMSIVRLVTGVTILRGPGVLVTRVALCTGCLPVFPTQWIRRRAMVECGPLPALERVALRAILA